MANEANRDIDAEIGTVTHEEAEQLALAYIDKAFNNPEKPGRRVRHSIPANPREDSDLRLMAYIRQRRAAEAPPTKPEVVDGEVTERGALLAKLDAIAIAGENQEDRFGRVSVRVSPSDLAAVVRLAREATDAFSLPAIAQSERDDERFEAGFKAGVERAEADEIEHEGRIAMRWSEILASGEEPRAFRAFRAGYHAARVALNAAAESRGFAAGRAEYYAHGVLVDALLARIHRDGGQHTLSCGLRQSLEDADAAVVALLAIRDEAAGRASVTPTLHEALSANITAAAAAVRMACGVEDNAETEAEQLRIAALRCRDLGDALRKATEASVTAKAEGWIRCEDKLPADREHVLVCAEGVVTYGALHVRICPCGGVNCTGELDPPQWREADENQETIPGVTHWMPLPPAPADTELPTRHCARGELAGCILGAGHFGKCHDGY
jgi:hypothetical protein